jgi:hypothetical protein
LDPQSSHSQRHGQEPAPRAPGAAAARADFTGGRSRSRRRRTHRRIHRGAGAVLGAVREPQHGRAPSAGARRPRPLDVGLGSRPMVTRTRQAPERGEGRGVAGVGDGRLGGATSSATALEGALPRVVAVHRVCLKWPSPSPYSRGTSVQGQPPRFLLLCCHRDAHWR